MELDDRKDRAVGREHRSFGDEPFADVPDRASALPGGLDPGVGQPEAGRFQGRGPVGFLGLGDIGPSFLGLVLGDGGVELRIRLDSLGVERLGSFQVPLDHLQGAFRLGQVGLGDAEIGFGLGDLLAILVVLENGDQLALPDGIADVDQKLLDPARNFRGDGKARLGDQGAREQAHLADRPAPDLGGFDGDHDVPGPVLRASLGEKDFVSAPTGRDQDGGQGDFHRELGPAEDLKKRLFRHGDSRLGIGVVRRLIGRGRHSHLSAGPPGSPGNGTRSISKPLPWAR